MSRPRPPPANAPIDGPQSLVVFGLTDATELRFTVPDYFHAASGSGFGDLALGVKQQIGHTQSGFDASLVVSLTFPTGQTSVSSHGDDPALQLPWSQKLADNWTAAGMLSVYWLTQSGIRNTDRRIDDSFDRQLNRTLMRSSNTRATFPERGAPGICCTSAQHINWVRSSRWISMSERVCLARPWIASLALVIHFDSRPDGNE